MATPGEVTSFLTYLMAIKERQGEMTAELRAIQRTMEERGELIRSIDNKLDALTSQQAVTNTKVSFIGSIAGLIGGGLITFLTRQF